MKTNSPLKNLRTSLQLSQLAMSDLLGISLSHFAMAQGGHRNLPGHSLIRVLLLHQLISEYDALDPKTFGPKPESDPGRLINELQLLAGLTGIALQKMEKKEKAENDARKATEYLNYILANFERLEEHSNNPRLDQLWKDWMEAMLKTKNTYKDEWALMKNDIEKECLAFKIQRIKEKIEAIRSSQQTEPLTRENPADTTET